MVVVEVFAPQSCPQADTVYAWKRLKHLKLFSAWIVYAAFGVIGLGFDFSLYGQLLAYPVLARKFGIWDAAVGTYIVPSNIQAAWNGSSSGCQVLFGAVCGPIMDRFGRKPWSGAMIVLQFVSRGVIYANNDWGALCVGHALQSMSPFLYLDDLSDILHDRLFNW